MNLQCSLTAIVLGALIAVCPLAHAQEVTNPPAIPRVRSGHPTITALIARGTDRSPTFRRLVETINASDGIVYLEDGPCGRDARGCLKGMSGSDQHRILRIWISSLHMGDDAIATIGHELRHAIEILSDPSITTTLAIKAFYEREGLNGPGWRALETVAAIKTEKAVRAELRQR